MPKFDFFLDEKISTWKRTEFTIDADNLEAAIEEAKRQYHIGVLSEMNWEEIIDTNEVLTPEDNGGESTAEIYQMNNHGDVLEIYNNKVDKVTTI